MNFLPFARQQASASAITKSSCSPQPSAPIFTRPAGLIDILISINSRASRAASFNLPILNWPFSSSTCTPTIKSRFGTDPLPAARSPPVIVTAVKSQPSRAARSISTTGAPTPVASTTMEQSPHNSSLCTDLLHALHNLRIRHPQRHPFHIPHQQLFKHAPLKCPPMLDPLHHHSRRMIPPST